METFTGEGAEKNNDKSSSVVLPNQNELRTSFLQRQSDGFPPTTNLTSPASGPGQVDRARYVALFPEDRDLIGIESLMT